MRAVRYFILGLIMLVVVLLALANKQVVTLRIMPEGLTSIGQWAVELPLFVVILLSLLLGMLLGYVFEWVRERRHRKVATIRRRLLSDATT